MFLENLRDRSFGWVEAFPGSRKKDAQIFLVHMHVYPPWVATGHQAGTGWGADRASGVEVGQAHAFLGHLIENRGSVRFRPEGTNVGIPQVVTEYDDDVWFRSSLIGKQRCENCKNRDKQDGVFLHESTGVFLS